jgi:hypothetical protein
MPSRMIDFEALWTSDKLAACKETVRAEYAWFYGLADAHGCFEINITAIHSRVSSIRPKLSAARIATILNEFHRHGLLFIWYVDKTYGFWTGSDRKGRLPPERDRHRYKSLAPRVPMEALTEYESRFRGDYLASRSLQGLDLVLIGTGEEDGKGLGVRAPEARGFGTITSIPGAEAVVPGRRDSQVSVAPSNPSTPILLPLISKYDKALKAKPARFLCPYCEQDFPDPKEFQLHACRAKIAAGWECVRCHVTFPTIGDLRSHLQSCSSAGASIVLPSEP